MMDFNKSVTVLTKVDYNEWVMLLRESGVEFKIVNQSDYTGFQVKLMWKE